MISPVSRRQLSIALVSGLRSVKTSFSKPHSVRRQVAFVLLVVFVLSAGSVAAVGLEGNGATAHGTDDAGVLSAEADERLGLAKPRHNLTPAEMDLLARCINGESRSEPFTGQVAVGAVIMNRVKSPSFPNTVREVIYAKGQFEVVRNGQINLKPTEKSVAAAEAAAAGEDPTGGALYFFDPSKTRNSFLWSRPLKITIGCHRFTG
jgi:spore germination cell wall hydrolase CwlJ-like protein